MSKKVQLQAKIEHEMNFMGDGEHYVFYIKRLDEEEWGMSKAYKIVNGKMSADMVEYIRDLAYMGYEIMWEGRK